MGDRGHIVVHDQFNETPVVLYAHWGATRLPEVLARALAMEARWGDAEYLARIIFDKMHQLTSSETTSLGIGTEIHGDAWRVINVDTKEQMVTFREEGGYSTDEHGGEEYSFEEFIEAFQPDNVDPIEGTTRKGV